MKFAVEEFNLNVGYEHLVYFNLPWFSDDLRCKVWPLLLEVDPSPDEEIPSLEELSTHCEYQQVVVDVNRSLKRFPPGTYYIPQRLKLISY
ncbi:hypothetical protein NQ314_006398 [Rhamnusium bicolor]|uniref:Uncharacterized protein n=1 Tax=Rhamnusium bicolor TaxID=1586634 RepID=A0AAV8Z5P6_9CUCU|nr:hypothetical protein NQ314_006398 [Rhamnusium bicolor]